MNRGPALDLLNQLTDDEGFTCFTPDEGTRCEKTWQNEQYPVTDGRTLFWRDGGLSFDPLAMALTGGPALLLAWFRARTGSLLLPVLAHNAANGAFTLF